MQMMIDDDHHRRRDREQDLVDVLGPVVFLEDELQPVGQRLAEAEHVLVLEERDDAEAQPDAVGADAVLHPRGDLALQQDQVRDRAEDHGVSRRSGDVDPGGMCVEIQSMHACSLLMVSAC